MSSTLSTVRRFMRLGVSANPWRSFVRRALATPAAVVPAPALAPSRGNAMLGNACANILMGRPAVASCHSPMLAATSLQPFTTSSRALAYSSNATYLEMYEESISDPSGFWARHARENITWRSDAFSDPVADVDLARGHHAWFKGGTLNVTETLIDRHIASGNGDNVALLWESDEPGDGQSVTYSELHDNVCRLANALKAQGVGRGTPVCLYMPMTPMAVYSMLACARLGAPHSIVFAGFSADALRSRIQNIGSRVVMTADEGVRGGKTIPLKAIVDEALVGCEDLVDAVFVSARTGNADVAMVEGRDIGMEEAMKSEDAVCEPEIMEAEDPLFYLYTSGSTGAPKGLQHASAGYLAYAQMTHKYVFDYRPGDIFACVADVGWITGHTYVVYGPLANGATTVLFESIPTYPDAGRYWEMVERLGINQLYTAPTAIRLLIKNGDDFVTKYDRSSLRTLGTVGEPINPEAWRWYHDVVGEGRCAIVDTWWQTETGGHMLTPLATDTDQKPGAAMRPFFGVEPALLDGVTGEELEGNDQSGLLVMKGTPPGMSRTIFGDHQRFLDTYYNYPGYYFSGDGAHRDADGHYWITGRVDDVINVSGHRLGTAEVESALVSHDSIAEAAVVGFPHEIKGEGIYAYVILKDGENESPALLKELVQVVRKDIGPFANPEVVHVTPDLPKTRSGKIMRRILRKVASKEFGDLGDVSTLAVPEVVDDLIEKRQQL